jgi:hypothetical protein
MRSGKAGERLTPDRGTHTGAELDLLLLSDRVKAVPLASLASPESITSIV